jgi:hypothetical protein
MQTPLVILNPSAPEVTPPEVRAFLDAELIHFARWVSDYSDTAVAAASSRPLTFSPRLTGWTTDAGDDGYSTFEVGLHPPATDQEREEMRLRIRKVIMKKQPLYLAYVGLWREGLEGALDEGGDVCGRQLLVGSSWNSLGDAVLMVRQLDITETSCKLKDAWPISPSQRLVGWLPEVIRRTMATAFVLRKAGVNEVSKLL